MTWSGQYGKWRFVYISVFRAFTDKNYLYPPFNGLSRLEHHVCLGNTKYKQNLTLLSKRSMDLALQVPFLASGLHSFMAIALIFVELCPKDSILQSGSSSDPCVSRFLASSLRINSSHFSQDCRYSQPANNNICKYALRASREDRVTVVSIYQIFTG